MLYLHFFSAPLVLVDNQPLTKLMGSPTLVSLLAYLVMQRERPLARSLVAATFWGDSTERHARRNLNSHLYRLKTLLGSADYVWSERETIQFNPHAPFWLDVVEFETRTAHLLRASTAPAPHATETQLLESAAALYRGEFLEGVYEDWTLPYREQLRECYLLVLQRLVETYQAQADYDAAIHAAARWVNTDAYCEAAHYHLIQLYTRSNRLNQARNQFEQYQSIWRGELRLEPSAHMRALADQFQLILPPTALQNAAAHLAGLDALAASSQANARALAAREQKKSDALNWQIAQQAHELGLAFQERGSSAQAARYLTRALDALAALPLAILPREQEWAVRVACDDLYDWDSNWTAALENLRSLEETAKALDSPARQAEALARRAWLKIRQSHHPEAIALAEQVLQISAAPQDYSRRAWAERLLGVAYDQLGDFRAALTHYRAALTIDETTKSAEHLSTDLNNIACILETMGDFALAEQEFERARNALLPTTPLRVKISLQANLGNLWTKLKRLDAAARELNQAMEWVKQLGERELECWVGACLARSYQRRGENERALLLTHHYYHAAQQLDAAQRKAELAAILASLYLAQQDAERAHEWAELLHAIAETQNFWRYRVRAAMRLAQAYHLLNDSIRATTWARHAVGLVQERGQPLEETTELYTIAAQCNLAFYSPPVQA